MDGKDGSAGRLVGGRLGAAGVDGFAAEDLAAAGFFRVEAVAFFGAAGVLTAEADFLAEAGFFATGFAEGARFVTTFVTTGGVSFALSERRISPIKTWLFL